MARLVGRVAGVSDRVLAINSCPANVIETWHHLAHFIEDAFCAVRIMPRHAERVGQINQNVNIRACITWARYNFAATLDLAVRVGKGAIFLIIGRCWQDNISLPGCFSEENVLNHKEIKLGQCVASMMLVGVRHCWVFAHNIHGANLVRVDRIHDFDHGQSFLGVQILAPKLAIPALDLFAFYAFVVWVEHWD